MNYRIKTKDEFISQYGTDFRNKVCYSWTQSMDYLFGKQLTKKQSNDLKEMGYTYIDEWCISGDMVTKNPLKVTEAVKPTLDRRFRHENSGTIPLYYEVIGNALQVQMGDKIAIAKCHPDDKFNFDIGMAVALTRLARQLGEYEAEEKVVVKKTVKHNIVDEI